MDDREEKNHHDRVELLKDVFILIYPEFTSGRFSDATMRRHNHEERKKRVQQWFTDIQQDVLQEESPWSEERRQLDFSLLPRFMQMLRECVLMQQWTQVLTLLDCISHIPYGADWTIWKATLTALYTEPEHNTSLIEDFFKQSYLLQECNVRDIVLEFVQFLISQGKLQEASQAIQKSRPKKRGVMLSQQRDFTGHLKDLLDAYQGLIYYVEWKAALSKRNGLTQNTLSESFYDVTSVPGLSDDAVKSIAQKALLDLDRLQHKRGVWDIFITKLVEIHEYYEEFDEARAVLRAYQEHNPDNINSHRFLQELLERNHSHYNESADRESITCLKNLAKADPANPLVLTLCHKLSDAGEEHISYTFGLLDNIVWRDKLEGWQWLMQCLTTGLSRDETDEVRQRMQAELEKCWSSRQDWWPHYHFDPRLASKASSSELLLAKSVAASLLVGPDCSFVEKAREVLDQASIRGLDKILLSLHIKIHSNVENLIPRQSSC